MIILNEQITANFLKNNTQSNSMRLQMLLFFDRQCLYIGTITNIKYELVIVDPLSYSCNNQFKVEKYTLFF